MLSCFLFLFLQGLNYSVDGSIAFCLGHSGQCLQTVLQIDGRGIGHQFIEHFGALHYAVVVLTLLAEQTDGLAITGLCLVVAAAFPIELAQSEHQDTLLHAASGGLAAASLVVTDGSGSILLRETDVAHRVVHLIQIGLVVVRARHPPQPGEHTCSFLAGGSHLGLSYAGIEGEFVGRVLTDTFTICLIGCGTVPQLRIQLSQ